MKICCKCKTNKEVTLFHKNSSRKDGYAKQCKSCKSEYYSKDKEKVILRTKQWKESNKEKDKTHTKTYRNKNKAKKNLWTANRRAKKLKATPEWLTEFDKAYITMLYIQALELEKLDNVKRHVDHIVPLQGKHVSGLHVPWNLQILTAHENLTKGNK